jgi:hypothetical protein
VRPAPKGLKGRGKALILVAGSSAVAVNDAVPDIYGLAVDMYMYPSLLEAARAPAIPCYWRAALTWQQGLVPPRWREAKRPQAVQGCAVVGALGGGKMGA